MGLSAIIMLLDVLLFSHFQNWKTLPCKGVVLRCVCQGRVTVRCPYTPWDPDRIRGCWCLINREHGLPAVLSAQARMAARPAFLSPVGSQRLAAWVCMHIHTCDHCACVCVLLSQAHR